MQYSFNPRFNKPIEDGTKIHTFRWNRKDKRLPKVGAPITFVNGARTKNFRRIPPYKGVCYGVQKVRMVIEKEREPGIYTAFSLSLHIGNKRISTDKERQQIAINDGFEGLYDFCEYWLDGKNKVVFSGYCIHWTPFIYQ